MIKIAVNGISGRMGQAVCRFLQARGHEVGAAFDIETSPFIGKDAGVLLRKDETGIVVNTMNVPDLEKVDGIIDFTSPAATIQLLEFAVEAKKPIVIGTTGIDKKGEEKIKAAAEKIPVMYAPNMSVGVNILFKLTEMAAKYLPDGYDVEVFESHHKMKKDSPSGTARRLIDILKKNILRLNNAKEVNGRDGIVGERDDKELGVQVLRGGDIVGEHTVYLVGMGERIELTHRATNRDTFAEGSVRAVEYISDKKPGLYTMYDVLGL